MSSASNSKACETVGPEAQVVLAVRVDSVARAAALQAVAKADHPTSVATTVPHHRTRTAITNLQECETPVGQRDRALTPCPVFVR